jgi:hypothetical protein
MTYEISLIFFIEIIVMFNSNKTLEIGNDDYHIIVLPYPNINHSDIPAQTTQNSVIPLSFLNHYRFQFRKKDCRNAQF